jgi:hypothetical protein
LQAIEFPSLARKRGAQLAHSCGIKSADIQIH